MTGISTTTTDSTGPTTVRSTGRPRPAVAATLDVVVVLVFVTIGRSSHEEGITLAGIASTAWPFLVGLGVGWTAAKAWRSPLHLSPTTLVIWASTVAVGMVLRVVAGQGTAVSFIVVACCFLAATLFGWRLVALGVRNLRRRASRPEPVS